MYFESDSGYFGCPMSDVNFRCPTALEKEHWQWQFSDPASAIARKGFRPGQKQNI
jgi:hypothetical protein